MIFTVNTKDWGWMPEYWRTFTIELEDTNVKEGYALEDVGDLVFYLANVSFWEDGVYFEFIEDALLKCATELGCVYRNVYELENDIRRYYI